jgi:kynurenine formamidase
VLVDLSHALADGTITYPGLPGPVISDHLSRQASHSIYAEGYEFQIGRIEMVSNTGTYLDTPFHRFADGHDLAGLPLDRVADVSGVAIDASGAGHSIGADVLDRLGREIGRDAFDATLSGGAALFATGWDRHWGSDRYGDADHPHLTDDLVNRLVEAGVVVVGIDSVNIDSTLDGRRPVHTALLGAGILIVEHLTGVDRLVGRPFRFFAVPPRIAGMGTFPVRAFAIVDE